MTPGNIDHWYELLVWLALIIIGPGGGAAAANLIASKRRRKERVAEMEESVDLHRSVFDQAIDRMRRSLESQITETVGPILDRQAASVANQEAIARDLARIETKLDVNSDRHDRLERDKYQAIAKAERVIAKHHPEED